MARSFWLHTVLLGWGVGLAGTFLLSKAFDGSTARGAATTVLVMQPLLLLLWAWSVTGATVSAMRHVARGEGRGWGLVTLAVLSLAVLGMTATLPRVVPSLAQHWRVARGEQPTEDFRIDLLQGGRTVAFRGGVNDGAAIALDRAIGDAPVVGTVLLESPGGWLREGDRMADVVRRYRLNTRVEGDCFSACTLVMLAGANRSVGPAARIGFHRGRGLGDLGDGDRRPASRSETELYRKAGLRDDVVQRIVRTPSGTLWIPTHDELRRADIVNR